MTKTNVAIIDVLLKQAQEQWANMSSEQRLAMIEAQQRSFVRAEAGFGSDKDELEYRRAMLDNDVIALSRLNKEASERIARMEAAHNHG